MLDLLLRGAAIGTALASAVYLVSGLRGRSPWSVVVFAGLISCYLIVSAPSASARIAPPLYAALVAGHRWSRLRWPGCRPNC